MNRSRYIKMTQWFSLHPKPKKLLKILYKYIPFLFVLAYPAILITKGFLEIDKDFVTLAVVPPCVFIGITIMRKLINRERPYEKYGIAPVIRKGRKGCSFPSRHAASAFIIALSGYVLCLYLGIFLTILAVVVALTRILSGVHFISDVIFSIFFSGLIGTIFYCII